MMSGLVLCVLHYEPRRNMALSMDPLNNQGTIHQSLKIGGLSIECLSHGCLTPLNLYFDKPYLIWRTWRISGKISNSDSPLGMVHVCSNWGQTLQTASRKGRALSSIMVDSSLFGMNWKIMTWSQYVVVLGVVVTLPLNWRRSEKKREFINSWWD